MLEILSKPKQAEDALKASRRYLQALFDNSLDAILVMNDEGRYIDANPAACKLLGYMHAELVQLSILDLTEPSFRKAAWAMWKEFLATGSINGEFSTPCKDGTVIQLEFRGVANILPGIHVSSSRDITERKRAEAARREAEKKYRDIFENAPEGIFQTTPEGRFVAANPALARIFGFDSPEELIRQRADISKQHYVDPERREEFKRRLAEEGVVHNFECEDYRKDGSKIWVSDIVRAVRDDDGTLLYYEGTTQDITERKRTEEALRSGQERYRKLAENFPNGAVITYDRDLRVTFIAGRDLEETGVSEGLFMGKLLDEIAPPEVVALVKPRFRAAFEGQTEIYECPFPDGRFYFAAVAPLLDVNGFISEILVVTQNITKYKQAQEALRASEEQFRQLAENIREVFWLATADVNEPLYVSPAYEAVWGRTCESLYLEPRSFSDAIHDEDRAAVSAIMERDREQGFEVEYRVVRPDGSIRWVRDRGFPIKDESGHFYRLAGIAEDITERKRAEDELTNEKEVLEKIFGNIPVMIGFVGDDGVKLVNREWERTIGWTVKELREQNVDIFAEAYPDPSYRQEVLDFVAAATGEWVDLKIKVRDGRVIDAACAIVQLLDGTRIAIAQDITERKHAEEQLRQSEGQLAEAQRTAHIGSWSLDLNSNAAIWSDELYRIYGLQRTKTEPSFEVFLELLHPEDRLLLADTLERATKIGKPFEAYLRIFRPDGEERVIRMRGRNVYDDQGIPIGRSGTAQDVTEYRRVEEAVRSAEQKYRDIFENASEGIFQSTPDGRYIAANSALARMFGFATPDELIHSCQDISRQVYVDPARREEFKRQLEELGAIRGFEHEVFRKDGSRLWISVNARAVKDEQGSIRYYEGTSQDITARKVAEHGLRESEERYRELFENAKDATYVHDLNGRYTSVNRAAEKLTGRSREEIIGRTFSDFVPPDQVEVVSDHLCKKLAQEGETTYETEVVTRDGRRVPVEVSSHLIYENGIGVGVQGTARDITQRKRAEERLREYEKVVEGLEEMIAVVDRDFRCLLANHAFLRYRGKTREQVIGRFMSEVVGTDLFEGVIRGKLEQTFRGQVVSYESKATYPELGERDMLVSLIPIEGPTGIDRTACVLLDITERKKAEEALRESEARTRAILESAMDCIITINHEGLIVDWNPAAEKAFGYTSEDAVGKEMATLIIPLRHRENHRRGLAGFLATGKARVLGKRLELSALRSDGTEFPVELTITQIELEGKPMFTGYLRDITKSKQAEEALQRYPRQLIEAQETERKHIARELHDQVGQVLTAIRINLQSIGSSAVVQDSLIEQGVGLIDTALKQVRNLSFELRPSLLDNLGLEAALRWYCDQFTKSTGITARSTQNLPSGHARLGNELETACFRIVQEALTNVVRHAKAKNVSVELSAVDHTIALSIKDDGIGFDEAPPKDGAPSTSLGLRGMRERALALGGTLEIESGPTAGTRIRASFPNGSKKDR